LPFHPATHFCHTDGVAYSCGNLPLNPATQFCFSDGIYSKCGGDDYDPATHFCYTDNKSYSKCGGDDYNPPTQFCYEGSKIGSFCGDNPQKYYDPDIYECKPSVNSNGIFLKNPVPYQEENYEAVLIGEQTWLARNLNYNVSGSRCYGDNTGGDSLSNCGKYGRLYNWATAMKGAASSNSNPSGVQGICPGGWHIPSNAEWDALITTVGDSSTAGTKQKTKNGWTAHTTYGNGTDDYGFSALPGGYRSSGALLTLYCYRMTFDGRTGSGNLSAYQASWSIFWIFG
jgi:uncharacterized protein (TIGR02145 family)